MNFVLRFLVGRVLDYVIEPAYIDLPFNHRDSTKITQVACGRAHTLILTDKEGGRYHAIIII